MKLEAGIDGHQWYSFGTPHMQSCSGSGSCMEPVGVAASTALAVIIGPPLKLRNVLGGGMWRHHTWFPGFFGCVLVVFLTITR